MRALVLVLAVAAALTGCKALDSCPSDDPLDCGDGCCPSGYAYHCGDQGKCYQSAPSTTQCTSYTTCLDSSGGGGECAYWSCGTSSQCAQVMGASSGTQCQFEQGQTCEQWCQKYIPGNCSCH